MRIFGISLSIMLVLFSMPFAQENDSINIPTENIYITEGMIKTAFFEKYFLRFDFFRVIDSVKIQRINYGIACHDKVITHISKDSIYFPSTMTVVDSGVIRTSATGFKDFAYNYSYYKMRARNGKYYQQARQAISNNFLEITNLEKIKLLDSLSKKYHKNKND